MSVQNLLHALEANLQAGIAGKDAQIALLEREEAAIAANDPAALEATVRELQGELQREVERTGKLARLLAELRAALGTADAQRVSALTAALGPRGARIEAKRATLRARCAEAARRGRRVGALVRGHAALLEEALGRFLAPDPAGRPLGRGSLVDAEA